MKEKKDSPSPLTYEIFRKDKSLLGKIDKTQGISFMSEAEFLGKEFPSPWQYAINERLVTNKVIIILNWICISNIKYIICQINFLDLKSLNQR